MNEKKFLQILSNKKVLHAEDEIGIRKNVSKILDIFFEKVISAKDGKEAIQLYETENPDMIIVDICMPQIDGLDVVKHIRRKNKKIPIIVLSAYRDEEYLWRAIEQKISKYLMKPFNKEGLLDALSICALELVDYDLQVSICDDGFYDPCTKIYKHNGKDIILTQSESKLLELLITKSSQNVSYDEISYYLWENELPSKDAIKALVKDLRKKIGKEAIKNIYAMGYKLDI